MQNLDIQFADLQGSVKTIYSERHRRLIQLLTEYRQKAGLSQSELARRLNQHQSFIARIESGQRGINVVEFLAIAEAIGNFTPSSVLREVQKAPAVELPAPRRRTWGKVFKK
jgi:transcriptional regulator with XRE-family HTH domain